MNQYYKLPKFIIYTFDIEKAPPVKKQPHY